MLSPHVPKKRVGHVALDRDKRPGLVRALVISKFPKFRAEIISALQASFEVDYYSTPDAAKAGLAASKTPGLIVIDYEQLVSGSRDFIHMKLETPRLHDIPMLVTGRVSQEEFNSTVCMVCPTHYLQRPFMKSTLHEEATKLVDRLLEASWNHLPVRAREALQLSLSNYRGMARKVRRGNALDMDKTKEGCFPLMEEVIDGQAARLIENVKDHNNYTYVHSVKVATLMSMMGNAIGIKGAELLTVATGGMLIDVGKLAVSQELLNSPDQLDRDELKELKSHVLHSHTILERTEHVNEGVRIITDQHHEKLDGSGYPKGLTGRDLNELARLATIVDIFCALTDKRPYKPAYTAATAIKVLEKMEGKLDPFLLALFKEIVMSVYADDDMDIA